MKYYEHLIKITTSHACLIFNANSKEDKQNFSEALLKTRADAEDQEEERQSVMEKLHQYLKTDIVFNKW
jgi:hypothetical protein